MKKRFFLLPLTLLLATGMATTQEKEADLSVDMKKAHARAAMHNKRVLVALSAKGEDQLKALKGNRALSRKLRYEFEAVSSPVSSAAALWKWQGEGGGAIVFDASGKELARFQAADLQGKDALKKLEPLFCKPVDADKKLADALVVAKKTGRNVFIRFDAPW
jgi:hypothetical protein